MTFIGRTFPLEVAIAGEEASLLGEVKVTERTPLIELNSAYGTSLIRDVVTTTGSGNVSSTEGEILCSTGATASSSAEVKSAENGRYIPGSPAEIGIGVRIPTAPTGNQYAEWGGKTVEGNDGFYFGHDSTGVYVARNDGATETKVYQSSWNIDPLTGGGPSGFTLSPSAGQIYQIDFTWYGYGQIVWGVIGVIDGVQDFLPVHQMKVDGNTSIESPNLQVYGLANNGGDTTDFDVYVGGRQYSIVGKYLPKFRYSAEYRASVNTSTTRVPLISFRGKTGFLDRSIYTNEIVGIVATEPVIVELVLDGSLTGASYGTPTNYTAGETACEVDISATAITGGTTLYSEYFATGSANKGALDSNLLDIVVPEDQPITFCARTISGTGTIESFMRMREEW